MRLRGTAARALVRVAQHVGGRAAEHEADDELLHLAVAEPAQPARAVRLGGRASGESARISAGESTRGVAGRALRPGGVPGLLAPRLLGLAPGHLALLGGPVSGLLGGLLCSGLLRGAPLVPVALLGVVLEGLLGVVAVRAC